MRTDRPIGLSPPRWARLLSAVAVLALLALGAAGAARAAVGGGPVHRVEITGEIDLGLAPFLERVFEEAEEAGASAVVLVVDTPGGRLDAVLQMRDALMETPVPTVAFVDDTAFSAGALVALATDRIFMTPGAVMGAATPVDSTGATAEEKIVSAVSSTFRATAEEQGRDPLVAEAMVDPGVVVEGLSEAGELLTLTTNEAVEVGYADGVATSFAELLDELELSDRAVVEHEVSLAERMVRFITNPIVASLLITLGVWLLVGDLLIGGVGLAAVAGVASLGLFFWGHQLAGLAGWEDVALLVLGVVLVLIEVFVVPGFGVAGVIGMLALLGGAFLAMLHRDLLGTPAATLRAATTVGASFLLMVSGFVVLLWYLSRRQGGGLVLRAGGLSPSDAETSAKATAATLPATSSSAPAPPSPPSGLRGAEGLALSDLRPAGIAEIGGRRVDVVSEGEYIPAGAAVEVILDEGYRRVVRRRRPHDH